GFFEIHGCCGEPRVVARRGAKRIGVVDQILTAAIIVGLRPIKIDLGTCGIECGGLVMIADGELEQTLIFIVRYQLHDPAVARLLGMRDGGGRIGFRARGIIMSRLDVARGILYLAVACAEEHGGTSAAAEAEDQGRERREAAERYFSALL